MNRVKENFELTAIGDFGGDFLGGEIDEVKGGVLVVVQWEPPLQIVKFLFGAEELG